MEWPEPEYHKLFPANVLLDVHNLTPLQRGGWLGIWLWMHRQYPPGLMHPVDLERLQEWSELGSEDWAANQVAILGRFKFHAATCSLHDIGIQRQYVDWAQLTLRKRAGGKASADRRNSRKIGGQSSAEIDQKTPYDVFRGEFVEIREKTWPQIVEIIAKNAGIPRLLQESSKTLRTGGEDSSTSAACSSMQQYHTANAPTLGEAGAGGGGEVEAFLARHTDAQLASLQAMALPTASPFLQVHLRDKQPRSNPMLANLIFNFAADHPDALTKAQTLPALAGGIA